MTVSEAIQKTWFDSHLQVLMNEVVGEEITPDDDGDYAVEGDTAKGWVRPVCTGVWGVKIMVIAAFGVPDRVSVLREITTATQATPPSGSPAPRTAPSPPATSWSPRACR